VKSILPIISVFIILIGLFVYLWLWSSEYAYYQILEKRADDLTMLHILQNEEQPYAISTDSIANLIGNPTLNDAEKKAVAQVLYEQCLLKSDEELCLKALLQSNFVIQSDSLNLELVYWRYHILLHLGDTVKANIDYEILTAGGYELGH